MKSSVRLAPRFANGVMFWNFRSDKNNTFHCPTGFKGWIESPVNRRTSGHSGLPDCFRVRLSSSVSDGVRSDSCKIGLCLESGQTVSDFCPTEVGFSQVFLELYHYSLVCGSQILLMFIGFASSLCDKIWHIGSDWHFTCESLGRAIGQGGIFRHQMLGPEV